jgi:hypothetical protein
MIHPRTTIHLHNDYPKAGGDIAGAAVVVVLLSIVGTLVACALGFGPQVTSELVPSPAHMRHGETCDHCRKAQ